MKKDTKSGRTSNIEHLMSKIADLTEALQRERADSLNLRRRVEEERAGMGNYYKATIIRELLPAVDNLERALMHVPKDLKDHDYVKGVQGVIKQFEQCLKQLGVERIKTKGEHFDPHFHEAVHMDDGDPSTDSTSSPQASLGQVADEIVSEELQAGYKLGNEVIRPAMVKVRKGKL